MGLLENSIGAMFGQGPGDNSGPSFGGAPYAPLATALIGLLATKAMTGGFGNLGGMFGGGQPAQPGSQPQGGGGLLGGLGGLLGGGQPAQPHAEPQGAGGLLGGLGGLMHSFEQNGLGHVAQSWVGSGQNQPVQPQQIQQAVGPDMIRELAQRTGMSEQDVAHQLSQELPDIINKLTPEGRLPTHDEASGFLNGTNPLQGR